MPELPGFAENPDIIQKPHGKRLSVITEAFGDFPELETVSESSTESLNLRVR